MLPSGSNTYPYITKCNYHIQVGIHIHTSSSNTYPHIMKSKRVGLQNPEAIHRRQNLSTSIIFMHFRALLVSVTVCSTQVASFFLLSCLRLIHSVTDTKCLPSTYPSPSIWIGNVHWRDIWCSEWSQTAYAIYLMAPSVHSGFFSVILWNKNPRIQPKFWTCRNDMGA